MKILYAVAFAWYSRRFGRTKIVLQEIYVILEKFEPQGLENHKIVGS